MEEVKEYLNHVRELDDKIDKLLMKKESLYTMLTSVNAKLGDDVRVQTSKDNDKLASTFVRIEECEQEINTLVDKFVDFKGKVIEQIHNIDNKDCIRLLDLHYIQYKNFTDISSDMNFTYQYVIELHGKALKEFTKVNPMVNL